MQIFQYLLAVTALTMPVTAIAQDARCISRDESRAVVANLMPELIANSGRHCAAQIGDQTFLARNADELGRSLSPHAKSAWPAARAALERLGGNPLPDNAALLDLGRNALATGIVGNLDADSCGMVNTLVEQIAPLPAENFANVFALFLEAGMNADENAALRVCPQNT